MKLLVTGAAGFIGSNFVRYLIDKSETGSSGEASKYTVVVLDKLTYAGNLENLAGLDKLPNYSFVKGDICDEPFITELFKKEKFDAVMNFAAESHVDRSILDPLSFVQTNIVGTQVLLNASMNFDVKKYVQVSTDEVYGSLGPEGRFTESTPIQPSSAYSASKAGADMLVLAAAHTHHYNVCVTRCTNNYGPYQFPEKLLPLFITNAMNDQPLPLYGDGKNVRSWLHVDDHSRALLLVLKGGKAGEVYNIGGNPSAERENREMTQMVLELTNKPATLIKPVEDRKGHDRRYAVDYTKIKKELGWEPQVELTDGLKKTVDWYKNNEAWWKRVKSGEYLRFYEEYYGKKL
jgi:dTDP-glucose 4,6-dehydratase